MPRDTRIVKLYNTAKPHLCPKDAIIDYKQKKYIVCYHVQTKDKYDDDRLIYEVWARLVEERDLRK